MIRTWCAEFWRVVSFKSKTIPLYNALYITPCHSSIIYGYVFVIAKDCFSSNISDWCLWNKVKTRNKEQGTGNKKTLIRWIFTYLVANGAALFGQNMVLQHLFFIAVPCVLVRYRISLVITVHICDLICQQSQLITSNIWELFRLKREFENTNA